MTFPPRWLAGKGELALGGCLLALGVYVVANASSIRVPAGVSSLGPRFFPTIVGCFVCVVSLWVIVDVLRGQRGEEESSELTDPDKKTDWRRVLLLVAVVLVHIALVDTVGWIPAGAFAFWGVAVILGSRNWVRDPFIAIAIAVVTYLGFTRGLDIDLPAGFLEGIL